MTLALGIVAGTFGNAGGSLLYDRSRTNPETIAAEPIFTVKYAIDAWRTAGGDMIYPHSPTMDDLPYVSPQQGCLDFPINGYQEGGVDFQRTVVDLYANGAHDRMVVIDGIKAEIVQTDPPSRGTLVTCPLEGEAKKTGIAIDLDQPMRSATELDGPGKPTSTPFFGDRSWELDGKEPNIFRIWAFAVESNYKWSLVVSGTLDGEAREWSVRDAETKEIAVFHTAGRSDDYTHVYAWRPHEPWWFEAEDALPPDPLACMPYRQPPAPQC